ncbi:hypothetical protein MHSWG343_05450 [Candidatus Mycoplasma haematohominis]|uniref:Uncharacterized protein n=1 Tax=Candidatus Mycoplasma haematohominis TaxID=1494318 RepID=A0A478FPW3_9MOLU|nr:hypothetical protein MHSWG343_05450 [Candidatus Mycoplasma haemohominis]
MKIFTIWFNKYGIPFLFIGSLGSGIKLYLGKQGYYFQTQKQNTFEDDITAASFNVPSYSSKVVEKQTFLKALQNTGYQVVNDSTKHEVLQNILIQRLYPTTHVKLDYKTNHMFAGSPEIKLIKSTYENKDKKVVEYLQRPTEEDTKKLKDACIKALQGERAKHDFSVPEENATKENKDTFAELSRLREWCTEPKIKDVLGRHKFRLVTDNRYKNKADYNIKQIIFGWFKKENNNKYWEKQSFLNKDEIDKILKNKNVDSFAQADEIQEEQIKVIRDKCSAILEKPFVRTNFYMPKDFLDSMENKTQSIDEFQEAALFCSEPTTSLDYVKDAMKGEAKKDFSQEDMKDYCYLQNKNVSDYTNIKTTDPFEGKTFWCAVRMIYSPKATSR